MNLRRPTFLALGVLGLFLLQCRGVTLPVRLINLGVQCQSAQTTVGSDLFTLGVGSTLFDVNHPNGDLAPASVPVQQTPVHLGNLYTIHGAGAVFFDDFFLDTPDYADANGDGVDDFFQPELGVSGISSRGYVEDGVDGAEFPLRATWSREAGSSSGICRLALQDASFPKPLPFSVPFEILNYSGVFILPEGGTSGSVFFRQTGVPSNTLQGPLALSRNSPDDIDASPATWLHSVGASSGVSSITTLHRTGTNYVGIVRFDAGIPPANEPRHLYWLLVVSDFRDANADGIPDLTDPQAPRNVTPTLRIDTSPLGLQLSIAGTDGAQMVLERTTDPATGQWTTESTFVLGDASRIQRVSRDPAAVFWRVRIP